MYLHTQCHNTVCILKHKISPLPNASYLLFLKIYISWPMSPNITTVTAHYSTYQIPRRASSWSLGFQSHLSLHMRTFNTSIWYRLASCSDFRQFFWQVSPQTPFRDTHNSLRSCLSYGTEKTIAWSFARSYSLKELETLPLNGPSRKGGLFHATLTFNAWHNDSQSRSTNPVSMLFMYYEVFSFSSFHEQALVVQLLSSRRYDSHKQMTLTRNFFARLMFL